MDEHKSFENFVGHILDVVESHGIDIKLHKLGEVGLVVRSHNVKRVEVI